MQDISSIVAARSSVHVASRGCGLGVRVSLVAATLTSAARIFVAVRPVAPFSSAASTPPASIPRAIAEESAPQVRPHFIVGHQQQAGLLLVLEAQEVLRQ